MSERAPHRVLVVEDDQAFAAQVEAVLVAEGCAVERETDGLSALGRMRAEPVPDLVLLDLLLPGIDGWSFYAELRANAAFPSVPIAVITRATAVPPPELAGIVGFLAKPRDEAGFAEFARRLCTLVAEQRSKKRGQATFQ